MGRYFELIVPGAVEVVLVDRLQLLFGQVLLPDELVSLGVLRAHDLSSRCGHHADSFLHFINFLLF